MAEAPMTKHQIPNKSKTSMTQGAIKHPMEHWNLYTCDAAETNAVKRALGEHAYKVAISATKSLIGHGLGASGGMETVATVKTIETGIIHPTINLHTPDPSCDLDYVPNVARRADVKVALKNSFGFGGQNSCLVIVKYEQ